MKTTAQKRLIVLDKFEHEYNTVRRFIDADEFRLLDSYLQHFNNVDFLQYMITLLCDALTEQANILDGTNHD